MSDQTEAVALGRPSLYTEELADKICKRLAFGESLNQICKDEGYPAESTVRLWALEDREGFSAKYVKARALQMEVYADEIIDIADESGFDAQVVDGRAVVNGEAINRARLRIDTRKWLMSKIAAKTYGERLDTTTTHNVGDGVLELLNAVSGKTRSL